MNKQINTLKEEIKKKDEKFIDNNKIIKGELEKLKKENKNLLDSNKEKDTELNKLKINITEMKKNGDKILLIKGKEQEIDKKMRIR